MSSITNLNLIKTRIVPFFYDIDLDDDVNALLAGLKGDHNRVKIIKRNNRRARALVQFIIYNDDDNREKLALNYNFEDPRKGYKDLFG